MTRSSRLSRGALPSIALRSAVFLAVLAACGGSDGQSRSAGGDDRILEPGVDDIFRVGTVDGGSWDSFTRITSATFDAGGRLYLLDTGTQLVHVVGPDGSHVRSFGTRGEGPGEFRSAAGVAVLSDGRIVVSDRLHQAFLLFDSEGNYVESVPMDASAGLPDSRLQLQGGTAIVAIASGISITASSGGGLPTLPTTVPIRRWDLNAPSGDGTAVLLEAWRPEREPPQIRPAAGGTGMIVQSIGGAMRAFEPTVHMAVLPDGRFAVSDSSSYRIRIYGPDGARGEGDPHVIGRDITPRPVGPAEEAAERERRIAAFQSGGGPQIQIQTSGAGGAQAAAVQEQLRASMLAQMESMEFWHEIPVITRLTADADGSLWVERSAGVGEEGPIDILDADGEWIGTIRAGGVRTPLAFGPNGLAAWIELDDLEVQSVRVGRIQL